MPRGGSPEHDPAWLLWLASCIRRTSGNYAAMSSPDSTSVSTTGDIRGRWFGVAVGATLRLGELRRGETIPWRVIAARSHRANAAARTDQMEPGLDRRDTSALLSAAIERSGGSAASGPVLQKPMSGRAGPRSPELPSCGHSAAKPNRHPLRTAVDSTLSVHATHGERAHSRRSVRPRTISRCARSERRTDLACPQCEDVRSCMLSVSPREPGRPSCQGTRLVVTSLDQDNMPAITFSTRANRLGIVGRWPGCWAGNCRVGCAR